MRFLMLNWRDPRSPKAGGAERVSLAFMAELARRGHQVFWFSHAFPGGVREEVVDGVTVVREGSTVSSILAARRWCRQQPKFDLVIDQHHGIPWYAPWWCGTRSIAYIHEVLGPIWQSFYSWPLSSIGQSQERWTHWLYRKVPFWTVCHATKEQLHRNGVKEVLVFPNGVNTQAITPLEPKPMGTPLQLIVVSRLAPNKRIAHAIQVLPHLLQEGVPVHLTVVGGGEDEHKLRQLVCDLKLSAHVSFTGPLPEAEKDARLRQAHLLVHTSVREGWGLNVIEANAMGTPAVVYPVPGLAESTVHQQTGLVSAAETPESIAHNILQLCRQPDVYDRYRVQAWERAKTFHWSQVLPPTCDWLESQARGQGNS
jgi:glycosyltransferase involved in cell wall biosynthesis